MMWITLQVSVSVPERFLSLRRMLASHSSCRSSGGCLGTVITLLRAYNWLCFGVHVKTRQDLSQVINFLNLYFLVNENTPIGKFNSWKSFREKFKISQKRNPPFDRDSNSHRNLFVYILSQEAARHICFLKLLYVSVQEFIVDQLAMMLDMTFPWYLELFSLRDIMIYGIRKTLLFGVVFSLKKKKKSAADSWPTLGRPTFMHLLGSV